MSARSRRRYCPGLKLCHAELAAAELHRQWQEKRNARAGRSRPGKELVVYFCDPCSCWHVGHDTVIPPDGPAEEELTRTVSLPPSGPDA